MARTYNDIKNRKKKKDEEESKTSVSKSESRVERMARKRQEKSIGFDTLSSDLNTMNSTLSGILGGWQSSDTMNSAKADVEKMYNRLGEYEDYRKNYGDNSLTDLSELLGTYESTLGDLDNRTAQYGLYENADAYKAEQDTLKRLYSMDSNEIAHQMANGAGRNKSVAYTTASGYNIKWQDLYDDANALETEQRVKKNLDYSETSKFKKKDVKYTTTLSGHSVVDDDDAHLYNYINGDEEAKDHETLVNVHMYGTSDTPMYERFEPEEKAVFNSLWETEGPEAAKKYAEVLSSELRKRRVEYERQIDAQNAKENPFGSSVASVIANVGNNALALPFLAMDYLDDNNIDPNSSLYGGRRFVNTTRSTVENDVIDNEVGRFFYRHGMNTADNLAVQAVSGFGMLGGVSKVAQTAIMSAGSFVDTAIDAKERGLTDVQALSLGTIAGAAEMVFESKSFDALFGGDNLSNGAIGYFLDNLKTELVGELGTELTNDVADFIIAQDMNQWKMSIDSYVKSGLTEKEALSKTIKENALKYLDVAAGTIFSSGVMSGPQAIKIQAENVATGKELKSAEQVGNVFDMASMSPEESQAYEAYTRYANKGVTADNISNAKLGNLYNLVKAETVPGINKAYKDREKATGVIGKKVDIMTSDKASERKKDNASKKADIAAKQYKNAQTAIGKYENNYKKLFEVAEKVSDSKYMAEKKAEAKKISADVETSVMAESNEAVDFKGVKFDGKDTKIITNDGEVSIKDVKLSEIDSQLITIAKDMDANVASAFVSAYDRSSNVDIDQYLNDFNLVAGYAVNERYTPDYILQHKGSLSAKQVTSIYENTVIAEARKKEAEFNKLISTTANNTPYKGIIDDSIFKNGTVNYNRLDKRQKKAVEFLKVFAAKSGMNLTFVPEYKDTNGAFDPDTNTLYISVGAGIKRSEGMLKDTIIPTASHEITHWMEEKSPELWEKLKNVALDALVVAYKADSGKDITQEDIISAEIKRLDTKHSGKKHTADDAVREIVARSCEDMLSMSEEGKKMFDTMSEAEQKTFKEKVMEIINNLKEWINEFLSSYGTQTEEAKLLRNYKDKLEEMSKIWDEMLVRSIEVNQALEKADAFNHLENGISEDGTTIVGKNNLQMSDKTYREGGRDFLVNWLDAQEGISEKEKWDIVEQTDRVAELMRAIDEGGELPDYSNWANMEVVKDENGEKVLSVIVKNGDYSMNIDFSQVCKKRVALDHVLNAMVQQGVLDVISLSESDMAELNAIIKEHDFEIACALCFVDAKRYRVNAWADSFCEGSDEKKSGKTIHKYGFNEMVRSLVPEGSKLNIDEFNFTNRDIKNQPTKNLLSEAKDSDLDFSLIDKIMAENDSKSAQYRYAKAIKENPDIRKILNSSEIISSIGLDTIRLESPKVYGLINGHQGTAKPKFAHSMVAYGNDVLKASNFTPESAKMVGGVRCQSFSDFIASMVVDYAQFISELAAKKLTSHSYTKEPLFVKLFGLTGMKINMSLVPKAVDMTPEQQKKFAILKDKNANKRSKEYKEALAEYEKLAENAGLDENGNYIWEDETFPYDIAMEIVTDRRYSKNCGTIAVGISNNHIRKLLADDRISMVIPYHKSGLNHEVAMMRDIALYHDYTDVQNTRDKKTGSKLDKKKGQIDFDFYGDLYGKDGKEGTHDPKKTAQNYLAWCDENNYIPKFDEFALNPNYYKLLIDFRVYDVDGTYVEQQPVQAIYPSNEEFNDLILNGVKDKNGKVYGGLKQQQETSDRLNAESQQIVAEFKQRLAEKYGEDVMQFSDKVAEITEDDYKNIKNHFGTTGNYNVAGYLLTDGKMLDFSGKHWGATSSTFRQVDHRDIQEALEDDNNGVDSMVRMIGNGNIRLMPETGGINLAVAPSKNQRIVLRRYIEFMSRKEGIIVDIDKVGGDTIKSFEYDKGVSADRVMRDIDNYFKGGSQSDLMRFHMEGDGLQFSDKETAQITEKDIEDLRSVGRKPINKFTSEDIKKAEPFARRMFKDIGIKSPFFRSWFGEWRQNDTKTSATIVDVPTIEIDDVSMENGDYIISDTGWVVHAGTRLKGETEHYARGKRISVKALTTIEKILNNAILLDTEVSLKDSIKKEDTTFFMHKLYAPIRYDGVVYIAKVSVEEFIDTSTNESKRKAYHLRAIKIETADGWSKDNNESSYTPRSNTVSIDSISDLVEFVKTYDKEFNPKEPSKVVNADKTPKIVYHGTDKDFNSFLPGIAGGIYFAGDRNVAEKFTRKGKVVEAYLDIKRPFVVDALVESEFAGMTFYKQSFYYEIPTPKEMRDAGYSSDTVSTEEIVKYAKGTKKYDGIIIENVRESDGDATTDYIVFNSTQVKSATDNVGTYSKFEENFQYSDKDNSSVYDVMGETERLRAENEQLRKDFADLQERLDLEKQLTHGNYFNENSLGTVAGHLRKISNSSYDKVSLIGRLKEVYSYIAHSENVTWDEMFDMSYRIAEDMLKESKPDVVVNREYKRILSDIRNTKISLDDTQISEAKYRFGNHYNRAFFNKVHLTSEGISLDTMWQDWAERYPDFFDASVSSGNQIGELYDIIESLQEASEIVEEYDMEEQARWLATEIYNQYWNVSTIKTTADKYDRKIKLLNYQHRNRMNALRESYNERVEKLKGKNKADRAKYRDLVKEIRESKDKKVAEAKALGKQRMAEYKENVERKTRIQRITANVLDLNEKLEKNSKDKHIPDAMRGAVIELLQAIDLSSKRLLKGGEPTKKDISLAKALGHLKDAITDGSKEVGDILDEMYGSGINDEIKDLVKSVDKYMDEIEGKRYTLNEMSNDDLKRLDTIVKIMKRTVNRINDFHVAQYNAGVQALGVQSVAEIDSRKKIFKDNNKHFEKLKTHVYWNNLNPYYAFKNLGEASRKIFTALQDGQDKLAFLAQEVIDFTNNTYTAKEYKEWSKTHFDFSVSQPNGKVVKFSLNVPQIMSLYCVTKQEDARRHILYGGENGEGGGITITETNKKEAVLSNIRLTEADLNAILDKLNDKSKVGRAKEVANTLQEFMCRRGAELGNEVTMARWGIKSFGIENYFPIKVSEGSVPVKNDSPGVDSTSMLELLNMAFTHARNKFSTKSVEIGDMFDVFSNHMSNMVRYNAMALPILDYYKWMNSRGVDEYGAEYSVQESIKSTFGDHAWKYFGTLLKDVSGATKKSSRDKLAVKFFKNAKIAKVAANIRVMALQFTSYIRAGAVIDNKYLLKSLNYYSTRELKDKAFKNSIAKAKEYCGIALWKSLGYYDTDITGGLTDKIKHSDSVYDKIIEGSMKGAEKADEFTWGLLWNACEFEIRDTRKDLKAGSAEYYEAVGKRLREVIYSTQVVDSVLTRSQMMRSPDMGDKILTTFASENTLSFSMATDVFTSYVLDKRSMGKEKAKEKNKKYMRKAITAFIVTNVVTSALQTLFDAFRDYDEDDKDEEYWRKLMLGNFASNVSLLNKIPYINLMVSVIQGFTPSRTDTDWMTNTMRAFKEIYKLFNGEGSSEKALRNTLKALSDSTGIAAYNVYRDIYALIELFND